ncbi:hypothetical protein HMPREF1531_00807 [Propionibacterium sp. oral taxon 192 str. F0372]|uniref:hypothetical protein n=1 Tax=Propionibacterium sp. oral taxon 192 TaxID=671222 RepID=UPI000353C6EA|nr:hypothetical protein [Propionibacterium sp. oral taxon 192]EPH06158.1 hypothetical protein HMPREF1531_00807 [Propionibacterium sp. oral taxon 192 str. F0372]
MGVTRMIVQPDWIALDMFERARVVADDRKKLSAGNLFRFEVFAEDEAVQYLHVGSCDGETSAVARLYEVFLSKVGIMRSICPILAAFPGPAAYDHSAACNPRELTILSRRP